MSMISIKIVPGETDARKLADAEVHFTAGPLEGLKLVGFGIWQEATGRRSVSFPGEAAKNIGCHAVCLLPVDTPAARESFQQVVLDAYRAFEGGAPAGPPGLDELLSIWDDDGASLDDKLLATFKSMAEPMNDAPASSCEPRPAMPTPRRDALKRQRQ
jgi:hypothetical protein